MDEEQFNREVGVRIRDARRRARLTQEQLAARCDTSRGSIANIELGDQAPPAYRLARIASALAVDLSSLLPPLTSPATAPEQARALGLSADLVALVEDVADAASQREGGVDGPR
jgi:transcriptional regulator with XRE-family HTH domain